LMAVLVCCSLLVKASSEASNEGSSISPSGQLLCRGASDTKICPLGPNAGHCCPGIDFCCPNTHSCATDGSGRCNKRVFAHSATRNTPLGDGHSKMTIIDNHNHLYDGPQSGLKYLKSHKHHHHHAHHEHSSEASAHWSRNLSSIIVGVECWYTIAIVANMSIFTFLQTRWHCPSPSLCYNLSQASIIKQASKHAIKSLITIVCLFCLFVLFVCLFVCLLLGFFCFVLLIWFCGWFILFVCLLAYLLCCVVFVLITLQIVLWIFVFFLCFSLFYLLLCLFCLSLWCYDDESSCSIIHWHKMHSK